MNKRIAILNICQEFAGNFAESIVTNVAEAQSARAASVGEAAPLEPANLTVFAAASLTEAFNETGQNFSTEHLGVTFSFNFAGSQQLAQQLSQAAPANVFASANKAQMQAAIDVGRVISGTQKTFACNRLVVINPTDNPAGITNFSRRYFMNIWFSPNTIQIRRSEHPQMRKGPLRI